MFNELVAFTRFFVQSLLCLVIYRLLAVSATHFVAAWQLCVCPFTAVADCSGT